MFEIKCLRMHINRLKKQWNEEEEEEEQNRMKWLGNIERTRIESLPKEKCSVEVGVLEESE